MVRQLALPGNASTDTKEILARIDVCLGGRVAEEIIFGKEIETSSGAENDLVIARGLAETLVSIL